MNVVIWLAGSFAVLTLAVHLLSVSIAAVRCRAPTIPVRAPADCPPVTIVRPVCGVDNLGEITLRSTFHLAYPAYEIVFCVANIRDPALPLIERLMAAYPERRARLLVGDDRVSNNPKLNNCVKGWEAAEHEWIVLADSNVLMPADYLARLMARWDAGTGLVCSPPAGSHPENFWAGVECAILNTYQARWQYTADTMGIGYAQGKSMLWRRDILEREGGIRALGREAAEDAAATKIVRAQGLFVKLADAPFAQPLGVRSASEVWQRQARWAKLRRSSFPLTFAPEILSTALVPMAAAATFAGAAEWSIAFAVAVTAIIWYGAEWLLAWQAGWPLSAAYPLHALARDAMLPAWWLKGWLGSRFEWRGNAMTSVVAREAQS